MWLFEAFCNATVCYEKVLCSDSGAASLELLLVAQHCLDSVLCGAFHLNVFKQGNCHFATEKRTNVA